MKKYLFIVYFISSFLFSRAQTYLPFELVRKYTNSQSPNKFDSSLNYLTNRLGAEIHYLYPLYQAIGWETKFKNAMGEKSFYSIFSQLLSFAGDYRKATSYNEKNFDTLSSFALRMIKDTINRLKNIQYVPAKNSIISIAPVLHGIH